MEKNTDIITIIAIINTIFLEKTILKDQKQLNLALAIDKNGKLQTPCIEMQLIPNDSIRDTINALANQSTHCNSQANFLLSNIGTISGKYATPLLLDECHWTLAIGKILKIVTVDDNEKIIVKPIMPISITFNHLNINGADAARLCQSIAKHALSSSCIIQKCETIRY